MNPNVSPFQRRLWVAQRVGWGVVSLLLLLAAAGGAGGSGPLSRRTVRDGTGGLEVRYERILRAASNTMFELRLDAAGDSVDLQLDDGFGEALEIRTLQPEPAERALVEGGALLRFRNLGEGTRAIRITLRPREPGRFDAGLRLAGGSWVRLELLVLP